MGKGRTPTDDQKRFVGAVPGARKVTISAADQKKINQRRFTYERQQLTCVVCGAPREPWSYPICCPRKVPSE